MDIYEVATISALPCKDFFQQTQETNPARLIYPKSHKK